MQKVDTYRKKNATIYAPNPSDANQEDEENGGSPSSLPPLKKSKTLHFTQSQKDLEKHLKKKRSFKIFKGLCRFSIWKNKVNYDDFIHDFGKNIKKKLRTLSQSDVNLLGKELKKNFPTSKIKDLGIRQSFQTSSSSATTTDPTTSSWLTRFTERVSPLRYLFKDSEEEEAKQTKKRPKYSYK